MDTLSLFLIAVGIALPYGLWLRLRPADDEQALPAATEL